MLSWRFRARTNYVLRRNSFEHHSARRPRTNHRKAEQSSAPDYASARLWCARQWYATIGYATTGLTLNRIQVALAEKRRRLPGGHSGLARGQWDLE